MFSADQNTPGNIMRHEKNAVSQQRKLMMEDNSFRTARKCRQALFKNIMAQKNTRHIARTASHILYSEAADECASAV